MIIVMIQEDSREELDKAQYEINSFTVRTPQPPGKIFGGLEVC